MNKNEGKKRKMKNRIEWKSEDKEKIGKKGRKEKLNSNNVMWGWAEIYGQGTRRKTKEKKLNEKRKGGSEIIRREWEEENK